jgi:hypothetical protein
MRGSPESVIVKGSVSALEYREAAWAAHDRETTPPDPSVLSDRALAALLRYELDDIPAEALRAVSAERRRRLRPCGPVDVVLGAVVLVTLAVSGVVIAWFLLAG